MRTRHCLTIVALQFVVPFAVPAQAAPSSASAIHGVVVTRDGHAIADALISISGSLLSTRSARDGTFDLVAPSGPHWIVARRVGFASDSLLVDQHVSGTRVRLQLTATPQHLRAITVEGERDALVGSTIAPETMRNVPPLGEPDVFRTLVLLPGVAQPNDLIGGLHLAGGSADETGVRLDGHPLQQPFHVFGALGAFNIASLDAATVRIHELPIDVDGHLGGIVDLETRARRPDRNHEADISIASASATALVERIPLGGDLLVSGRATYLNHLADAVQFNGSDGEPMTLIGYTDGLMRVRVPTRRAGAFDLLGYFNQDSRDLAGGRGVRRPMKWGEQLGGFRWVAHAGRYGINARASSDEAYATSRPRDTPSGTQSLDISQRLDQIDIQVSRLAMTWSSTVGATVDRRAHRLQWQYPGGPTNTLLTTRTPARYDRVAELNTTSAYAELTAQRESTRGSVGLRTATAAGRTYPAPRVSVRHTSNRLVLSAAAERRLQFTSYLEEPKEGSILQPVYLLDTPRIADVVSLGASWTPSRRPGDVEQAVRNLPEGVDLTVFWRRFPDRTLLRDDPREFFLDGRQLPPDFPQFARVRAHASGVTVGTSQALPLRSVAQLAYTYQRVREIYDGVNAPAIWDAPHSATIYLNTQFGRHWSLSTVGQLRSGAATTPVASRVFVPSRGLDDQVLASRYLLATRNSGRLPGYQRVDLSLRRTWIGSGDAEWAASLQVINALGRDNVMSYDWKQYYCWRAGSCRDPGALQRGLPIIPTLGLAVRW